MAYDLTNLGNVTNYISQQRQGGSYIPTNGSLGKPSQGWDGWNGYNPSQIYNQPVQQQSQEYLAGLSGMNGGGPTPPPAAPMPNNPWNAGAVQGPPTGMRGSAGFHGLSQPQRQAKMNDYLSYVRNRPVNPNAMKRDTSTLPGVVAQYGQQYGPNSYYFQGGINDYQSKLNTWTSLGQILGKTPEEIAMMQTGQGLDYWQQMQTMFDQGQHPTTTTPFTG